MSDTTEEAAQGVGAATSTVEAAVSASAAGSDERLAYRGVFARMLVRPEIGAAIAAVAIWVFFWAVSVPFGLAGGTAVSVNGAHHLELDRLRAAWEGWLPELMEPAAEAAE